jgi:hypothetical protein
MANISIGLECCPQVKGTLRAKVLVQGFIIRATNKKGFDECDVRTAMHCNALHGTAPVYLGF